MAAASATRRGISALLLSSRAVPASLRPLAAATHLVPWALLPSRGAKTAPPAGSGYSPLNDPSPNWSNRPPKETILLDGCDYEHWLIVMEFPADPKPTEEQMVDAYVKTLASVLGRYVLWPIAASYSTNSTCHASCTLKTNAVYAAIPPGIEMIILTVFCSEEEANKKIYSVCTTTYTGFGALISEELSYKVKGAISCGSILMFHSSAQAYLN
jgi:hypothetical protein